MKGTAAVKRMLTEQEKRQVRETDMLAFKRRYGKGVIDILQLGCQQQILLTIKGSHSSAQCNVRTNTNYNCRLMDDIDVLSGMPSLIRLSYLRICLNLLMPVPKACRYGTSTLCFFECYSRPRVSAHRDIEEPKRHMKNSFVDITRISSSEVQAFLFNGTDPLVGRVGTRSLCNCNPSLK